MAAASLSASKAGHGCCCTRSGVAVDATLHVMS